MSNRHSHGGTIAYGDARPLFPVEDLVARVRSHRNAQLRLQRIGADTVIRVRPSGFASSHTLTQHPLTTIEIGRLPDDIRRSLAGTSALDLAAYSVIKIGRGVVNSENHSLDEFTTGRVGPGR